MFRKTASGILLFLLLVSTLTLAFNIQPVKADGGTIYIRADGSIDPPTAPILNVENITYTFTDNIYDEIVVERDNIVVDGAGYTLQGTGDGTGISLSGRRKVTINNTNIKGFRYGIMLSGSSNNSIAGNNVTANDWYGVELSGSSYNTVSGNNITNNNYDGIELYESSNNSIYGNSVANNEFGIRLLYSSNNSISGNNVTANRWSGIGLGRSSNNSISGNNITNNGGGIWLLTSSDNILRSNSMNNNTENFGVDTGASYPEGTFTFEYFVHDIDASNTVDGKPIYYWINKQDMTVPLDAGYVALINCTGITVQNLNLTKNMQHVLLAYTTNSIITRNNITAYSGEEGIRLIHSSNNSISENIVTFAYRYGGISLAYSSNNSIFGNVITLGGGGIGIHLSSNNSILANSITLCSYGILLGDSSNNTIKANGIAFAFNDGISLGNSSNNILYHNNFGDNKRQVRVDELSDANAWDDGYPSGGNFWSDYKERYPNATEINDSGIWDTPYIIDENNVDHYPLISPHHAVPLPGEPIYIRADGGVNPPTAPITTIDNVTYTFTRNINIFTHGIVVERDNIIVDGAGYILQGVGLAKPVVGRWPTGIDLSGRSNVTIKNVNINAFWYGICLKESLNNSIIGNNITGAATWLGLSTGIMLSNSSNNFLVGNHITNNDRGIWLFNSSNYNSLSGNNIKANNWGGIFLDNSNYSSISGNTIASNEYGIVLSDSSYNVLRDNSAVDNGYNFGVWGSELYHFVNDVDVSNTVDGKPVYYWVNEADRAVPPDAGYVALVNCTRITAQNLHLTKNTEGMLLAHTTNTTITQNTITNNGYGIYFREKSNNNSISGNNITNNRYHGIWLYQSSNISLSANNIIKNWYGIMLGSSNYNSLLDNNIANNTVGIFFSVSSNNVVFHNNFVENTQQVISVFDGINVWDDGYPSGGNYWSNYTGVDVKSGLNQDQPESDGIGDAHYNIDAKNTDRYPLIAPITVFDAGTWNGTTYNVNVVSNSTTSNFQVDPVQKMISFNVTGVEGTAGFSRITIPNIIIQDMWQGNYTVLLNGEPWPFRNWTDATNAYIYINYTHSEHEIVIIPEFPSAIILPLFTLTTLIATVLLKKKRKPKSTPLFCL